MTTTVPRPTRSPEVAAPGLAPLQDALRSAARAQAADLVATARANGEAEIRDGRAWQRAQLDLARERGQADGAELGEADVAGTRREGRDRLLRARREVYDELVHRAREAVREMLLDPVLRAGLEAGLRATLGADVVVRPTSDGGLHARDGSGACVDASVGTLVAQALDELDLEDLWTPR